MCVQLLREIEEEVTYLLSDLIRIDTTNPPGNESEAAKYLIRNLSVEGINCEFFESEPGRGSVVSRLRGTGEKPSLLLLSHLDVVAADRREWSVHPFSGLVKDGFVWGRGALDMKGMTAIEVMTLKLLKRKGVKLRGDVILAATADEERGGNAGAGYLVDNFPEKILANYVLNEGGGLAIPVKGKNVYTVQTAEKGILWLKIKAKGTPGHGSVPGAADNAIMRMNSVVEKLGTHRPNVLLVPTVKDLLNEMAKEDETFQKLALLLQANPEMADQMLDAMAQTNKYLAEELRARLRMTITPTVIHGGVKENIIPSECEAIFDCRILPGQTASEAIDLIKDLLKDVDLKKLEFETIQANGPSESSKETMLYATIVNVLKEFDPDCAVAPTLLTGGTDSRFFRRRGSVCYGFHPARPDMPYSEMLKTVHGIDERISVENLVFGTSVLYEVVERFMT
ncbi:MAG: M20/M25/M40 family metallo-hydrolase [Candidatus Bathycorpusculaceae bacterium]